MQNRTLLRLAVLDRKGSDGDERVEEGYLRDGGERRGGGERDREGRGGGERERERRGDHERRGGGILGAGFFFFTCFVGGGFFAIAGAFTTPGGGIIPDIGYIPGYGIGGIPGIGGMNI